MRMTVTALCSAIFCAAILVAAPAAQGEEGAFDRPLQSERFEIGVRGWFTSIKGDTSIIREVFGGRIELEDELGISDDNVPELRIRWQFMERHALIARYTRLSYSGNEFIARPFVFDNQITGLFNRVESEAKLNYGRVGWRWTLVGERSHGFSLESIVDVGIYDVSASFRSYRVGNPFWPEERESFSKTLPIPLVGVGAKFQPHENFEVFGELAGMYAGRYGKMYDAEIGVRALLGPNFSAEAGYRHMHVDAEFSSSSRGVNFRDFRGGPLRLFRVVNTIVSDDKEQAKMNISGPFVGLNLRF